MFAEDVGLLPKEAFIGLLKSHRTAPATLRLMLQSLWTDMDRGGFSPALAARVLHFNGKLFKDPTADGYSLLLNTEQIDLLIEAAGANWREVEPRSKPFTTGCAVCVCWGFCLQTQANLTCPTSWGGNCRGPISGHLTV